MTEEASSKALDIDGLRKWRSKVDRQIKTLQHAVEPHSAAFAIDDPLTTEQLAQRMVFNGATPDQAKIDAESIIAGTKGTTTTRVVENVSTDDAPAGSDALEELRQAPLDQKHFVAIKNAPWGDESDAAAKMLIASGASKGAAEIMVGLRERW